MRLKATILCSAAMAAAFATPLQAQTGSGSPSAGAEDQERTAAETTPPAQTPVPDMDAEEAAQGQDTEIIVTGIRRSIETSQDIRRESDQIVDAIIAEDIGKLPDITASASLARVPGVQVNRGAGEAADVQVRGLPNIATTYNGREIFTAEGRFVAIQDFPAGAVAALEVYKSSTANLLEGGIGGLINVRSRRPFDFEGFELSGALNGIHTDQAQEFDWNGNLLISNRWKTGIGELGVLVNVAYTKLRFLDSTREQALVAGVAEPFQVPPGTAPGFRFPDATGIFYGSGNRWRPSVNVALQWRPSSEVEVYVDGLFQGYRGRDTNRFWLNPLYGPALFSNVVLQEDGRRAQRLTARYDDNFFGLRPQGYTGYAEGDTDTYQVAGGAIYDNGPLRLSADLAYTDSTFDLQAFNIDFVTTGQPVRNVNFDTQEEYGGPIFGYPDFNSTDPANFLYRGLFQENLLATGDDIQARADVEWETGFDVLASIQAGVRYSDRDASRQRGDRYDFTLGQDLPLASLPLDLQPVPSGFRDDPQPFRTWLAPTGPSIKDNIAELRSISGLPEGLPPFDPVQAFDANEKSYTAYGQIRYELPLGGVEIDGLVGLRAVRTEDTITGTARVVSSPTPGGPEVVTFEPVNRINEYDDYLPNASARLQIAEGLQTRLAYTETRTRPNFIDLSPSGSLSPEPVICTPDPNLPGSGPDNPNCRRDFFGGNPDLDPITSKNYDATVEYYFARAGSATVSLFRRDVDGFITRFITDLDDPEFGRIRADIPQNEGAGRLQGVEVAFTGFLDLQSLPEWARGFGLQANYTYIDSSTELPAEFTDALPPGADRTPRLAGVSDHSYNIIGIYERPQFATRLAYNYRSDFVVAYTREFDPGIGALGPTLPLTQRGRGNLDLSTSITPIPNITLAFDILNLLGNPFQVDREYEPGSSFPRQVRYVERIYSLGVRFRL